MTDLPTLDIDKVCVSYDTVNDVISDISIQTMPGEFYGLIGLNGAGKTTLITSLLYAKKHIFPVGMIMSGTEDSNGHYRKMFPSTFVYNKLVEDQVENREACTVNRKWNKAVKSRSTARPSNNAKKFMRKPC